MQRPVMNPSFMDEPPPRERSRRGALRRVGAALLPMLRGFGRAVSWSPWSHKPQTPLEDAERGSFANRVARGVLFRLALIPPMILLLAGVFVYTATHPAPGESQLNPMSLGIYYEPIELTTQDRVRLDAWLVPVVHARLVLEQRDQLLRQRYPAVILLHDSGHRREQVLPLVRPLHEAGFVVLVLAQRGSERGGAGQTFGLRESADVLAAVETLRRRPFIDPRRIAVVGIGAGGTAGLRAAEADAGIAAVVLDQPIPGVQQIMDERLGPEQPWLSWLRPLCELTFEAVYSVEFDELNLSHYQSLMTSRPVLIVDGQRAVADPPSQESIVQLVAFLRQQTGEGVVAAAD